MDPICHTLVGATLASTGLARRTRYGRATLIVAANLPDIDVVSQFWGYPATYAVRRGITHGLPAVVVLPFLLTLLVLWLDRLRPPSPTGVRADRRWLLALSLLGVASHPSLDWLNNYGMRWLMPFAGSWSYGDTLFIADWFAWLVPATALVAAWLLRRRSLPWYRRPAVLAIAVLLAYIGANRAITQAALAEAARALAADPPRRVMASPVAFDPLRRDLVLDYGDEYRFVTYRYVGEPRLAPGASPITVGDRTLFEAARAVREGRWFLDWARFPYAVAGAGPGPPSVTLADARYVRDLDRPRLRGFGFVVIGLPAAPADD